METRWNAWAMRGTTAFAAFFLLALSYLPAGASDDAAIAASREAIAASDGWRTLILNVPGAYVTSKAVSVEGSAQSVTNAGALVAGGKGEAVLKLSSEGEARIVIDLGVLASGFVELGVVESSGAPIRMSYAEDKRNLGKNGDAPTDPSDFFYNGRTLGTDDDPDGRADVFSSPRKNEILASPGLRGSERYIAITLDGPGTLKLNFVRVRQTNYSGPYDGHFFSSDDALNRAWYMSAYAMNLSTIRDTRRNPKADWVIVDGPKRDRVAYAGDLQAVAIAAYYQGTDYGRIVRDTINLFACQQYPDGTFSAASVIDVPCNASNTGKPVGPPDGYGPPGEAKLVRIDSFTAFWVVTLADYVRFTGDTAFAKPLLPVARRAIKFFEKHAPEGALWRADNYDGKLAFNWHTPDKAIGIDAYSNEAYYAALMGLADLERSVAGDEAAAHALSECAERVKAGLIAKLWDDKAGAFFQNTENPKRNHTADANVGALLFGMVDSERAQRVMQFLSTKLATPYGTATGEFGDDPYMTQYISPYILSQEMLGRFRYGDGKGALNLIRVAWPHMQADGPGTPWEEISMNGSPINARPGTSITTGELVDSAHAWSTAVPALSMYVVGASPIRDGYKYWSVRPHPVDLRWAQGDVPTPAGVLSVRWKRGQNDSSFELTVAAPPNTSGDIVMPTLGKARDIAMDGKIVWRNGKPAAGVEAKAEQDGVTFANISGQHAFAWN